MTPARTLILAEIGRMALIKKHMPILAEPYDGLSVGSMQNLKPVQQPQPVGLNCGVLLRTTRNAASLQAGAGKGSTGASPLIKKSYLCPQL